MKNTTRTPIMNRHFSFPAVLLAIVLLGCAGDDPTVSETDRVQQILTKSGGWTMQSVSIDGTDHTDDFAGLKVNFTATGYTSANGGLVWPASGSWEFADNSATTMQRDDGVLVTISEAADTQLVLALTWDKTTLGPGRVSSLKGVHVFTFGNP